MPGGRPESAQRKEQGVEQQRGHSSRRVEYISCKEGAAADSVAQAFDITVVDCSCTASSLVADPLMALHGGYAGRSPSTTNEQVAKPQHFRAPGSADKACVDGRSVIRIYSRWGSGSAAIQFNSIHCHTGQ